MFKYVKRMSKRAKQTAGESYKPVGKKPPLGTGKRFSALVSVLSKRKGVKSPERLASWIGRKVYGNTKFQALAMAGKKRNRQ